MEMKTKLIQVLKIFSVLLATTGLSASFLLAQAHLLNPGFEEYLTCPEGYLDAEQLKYWSSMHPVRQEGSNTPWFYQNYHHICDRDVRVYWKPVLGKGVISIPYSFDTTIDHVETSLMWTALARPLEKDSLYYLEYTTAPTQLYYPPDEQFYKHWCVSPNLGLSFAAKEIVDTMTKEAFLEPLYLAEDSGIRAEASNTLRIGNCYRATGEEEYFLFGHYRHPRNAADDRCLGSSINGARFGPSSSLVDNFRLEKMKLEICCDEEYCMADLVDFSAYTQQYVFPPGTSFHWNDGEEGLKRTFANSGAYQLSITMPCGNISSNWINIKVNPDCSSEVFIPNAFSPNGDGLNDYFLPLLSQDFDIEILRLSIFDRWGNQVYRHYENSLGWDGTFRGKAAPLGVYTWLMEYQVWIGDEPIARSEAGSLSLMR